MPNMGRIMRANRSFLRRAVRFLVEEAGIDQFLDLGSGVPTVGNVHEIAQSLDPAARIVYVDIESVAVTHARGLLADNEGATIIQADLRDTEAVLNHPELRRLLDLTRPVAVLLVGVLHQISDTDLPRVLGRYRDAMTRGSYLGLSQASTEGPTERALAMRDQYNRGYGEGIEMTLRSREEIMELFEGFELVEPGLVKTVQWRPDDADLGENPDEYTTFAGVGRKLQ
jgi:hypothetical protein